MKPPFFLLTPYAAALAAGRYALLALLALLPATAGAQSLSKV